MSLRDHVVIIGCGRVGRYVVEVLSCLGLPCLVIEPDAGRVIYPELEGGLQLLSQLLVRLGYSEQDVLQYTQGRSG